MTETARPNWWLMSLRPDGEVQSMDVVPIALLELTSLKPMNLSRAEWLMILIAVTMNIVILSLQNHQWIKSTLTESTFAAQNQNTLLQLLLAQMLVMNALKDTLLALKTHQLTLEFVCQLEKNQNAPSMTFLSKRDHSLIALLQLEDLTGVILYLMQMAKASDSPRKALVCPFTKVWFNQALPAWFLIKYPLESAMLITKLKSPKLRAALSPDSLASLQTIDTKVLAWILLCTTCSSTLVLWIPFLDNPYPTITFLVGVELVKPRKTHILSTLGAKLLSGTLNARAEKALVELQF